ncbi:MAG: YihY/virulence factor BrkB family protein [Saprospiraceae bacterium]
MNTTIENIKFYKEVLIKSLSKFSNDDIFTHAAALSYYTIFSLPPMLLIIISTTTWFYDEKAVKESIFNQIGELVGEDGAQQLLQTIERLNVFEPTLWATVLGGVVLIFTATSVFVTMQNALNRIFKVKPKPSSGWGILKMVKDRVLSFTLVIGVAFILLASLVVNALLEAFGKYLQELFGSVSLLMTFLTSILLPFVIITLMFAMIFKFLPDARLKWKDTWFGAILTSVLFVIGKYLISFYIGNSNVAGLYDAAGSVMVIMVWVFYAAIIVLYGAVFTFSYIKEKGERMPPQDFAVKVEIKEIEQSPQPGLHNT